MEHRELHSLEFMCISWCNFRFCQKIHSAVQILLCIHQWEYSFVSVFTKTRRIYVGFPAHPDQSEGFLSFRLWTAYLVAPLYISAGNLRWMKLQYLNPVMLYIYCLQVREELKHTQYHQHCKTEEFFLKRQKKTDIPEIATNILSLLSSSLLSLGKNSRFSSNFLGLDNKR